MANFHRTRVTVWPRSGSGTSNWFTWLSYPPAVGADGLCFSRLPNGALGRIRAHRVPCLHGARTPTGLANKRRPLTQDCPLLDCMRPAAWLICHALSACLPTHNHCTLRLGAAWRVGETRRVKNGPSRSRRETLRRRRDRFLPVRLAPGLGYASGEAQHCGSGVMFTALGLLAAHLGTHFITAMYATVTPTTRHARGHLVR